MNVSRRTVVWLIPVTFALHNAEEAFAFRDALAHVRSAAPPALAGLVGRLTYPVVVQALLVLSVLAFGLAAFVALRPESRAALWLLLTLETAVGINVIAHISTAVFLYRGYGPGLATAVLINAPFVFYCLRRAWRELWLSRSAFRTMIPAAIVLHGPVLLGG